MFRILVLVFFLAGSVGAQTLPANAIKYLPVLQQQKDAFWPDHPNPPTLGAQVEQETCYSLRHSKCWSPTAQLKTSREQGVGLGQITRAFRVDGSTRFDALGELKNAFPQELEKFSWTENLYDPELQLRALILKDLQNFRMVLNAATSEDRLAFAYAAYNGGLGGLNSDRAVCSATKGCDPSRWFGNVELTSRKAKKSVNGYSKSFFEINREYVVNVMKVRRSRYDDRLE